MFRGLLGLPPQPQSITALWPQWPVPSYSPTAWWQRHIGVNNLPKVVTQRCPEQDLNLRPTDLKPKCLPVTPPRHPHRPGVWHNCANRGRGLLFEEIRYTQWRRTDGRTFLCAELVVRAKAGRVVRVVGFERDAKEVSVGRDVVPVGARRRPPAAHPAHLTVRQVHVEIGKLDVVALRVLLAAARAYKRRPQTRSQCTSYPFTALYLRSR